MGEGRVRDKVTLLDVIKGTQVDGREEAELVDLDEPVVWGKVDDVRQDLCHCECVVSCEEGHEFFETLASQ